MIDLCFLFLFPFCYCSFITCRYGWGVWWWMELMNKVVKRHMLDACLFRRAGIIRRQIGQTVAKM